MLCLSGSSSNAGASQGHPALGVPGTLRRTQHWACSGGCGPGGSPRLHLAGPPPASWPHSTWRRPAGGGDGAGRRCAFPSGGPTSPPPRNFPPGGEVPGLRGVRRRRPGRRAEFLEGAARGSPQHGLLRHVVPRGHGEPRSSAGEPPTCGCLSPSTNLRGDDGLGLGSREIRRHGDDEGDLCSCRGGRGRRGGDPVSSPGLAAPRRCGPGFGSCPERGLFSGRRSPSVPGEEGGKEPGLLLITFGQQKQLRARGSGRAQLRLASLGFVFTAMPNLPEDTSRVRCTFNGEVTWLGKLTFS